MENWIELEQRFRAIAPKLRHTRSDDQTGAAGEHWRLAAVSDRLAKQQFESLSLVAGRLLKDAKTDNQDSELIFNDSDPKIWWYRALKLYSGPMNWCRRGIKRMNQDKNGTGYIQAQFIISVRLRRMYVYYCILDIR